MRGAEKHLVSGVTTVCLMQRSTSPWHEVDQVVSGLWNVVHPEHPKHAQWMVTCLEELEHFQLSEIVQQTARQHDVLHVVCHFPRTVETGIHP
jgi:hypothetical protein